MRIVHTSDWHVGRLWKNQHRLDETAAVLDHLARFLVREKVDLLLMSGDIFDSPSPGAEAEELVFGFFKRVGQAGTQCVVIAGNHDSPSRVDAWGMLTELVGVHAVGRLRGPGQGNVRDIVGRTGERAVVAALPFAPVRHWITALDWSAGEDAVRSRYAGLFAAAVERLSAYFREDAVNLLMAHAYMEGAVFGETERRVHLGADWAADPASLPATAHYVALGHLHLSQPVAAAAPAWYAGSALQLDFSEAGQEKCFLFVDAAVGKPTALEKIPYAGARPLRKICRTLEQIEAEAEALRASGWLHITVPLERPDPDLGRKVRALVPEALVVHALTSAPVNVPSEPRRADAAPLELYRLFHQRAHQAPPTPEVEHAFLSLYDEAQGGSHAADATAP